MGGDTRRRQVPGCTGACCDPVKLPAAEYVRLRLDPGSVNDGEVLVDMLRGAPSAGDLLDLAVVDRLKARAGQERAVLLHLTCRHFDQASRRCGIYDRRPQMCSSFPNGGPCEFCGATGTVLEDATATEGA